MKKISLFLTLFVLLFFTGVNVQANSSNQALLEAISKNDFALVKQTIDDGANVNGYQQQGALTPLALAIKNKNLAITSYLVAKGADVNKPVNNATLIQTPLIMAINNNDFDIIKLLVENGANTNITQKSKINIFSNQLVHKETTTPLIIAIQKDTVDEPASIEIVKYLIACGANVNQTDGQGYTPLMAAANTRWPIEHDTRYQIAEFLLESGANPNAVDYNNKTALQYAYDNDFAQLIHLLNSLSSI